MKVKTLPSSVLAGRERLAARAQEVLRQNDMGVDEGGLYPHQWSWDTGFIAIGLAHLDLDKMCLLIEVALHFSSKPPNIGMRPIVRNVIIVA